MKHCPTCKTTKPLDDFCRDGGCPKTGRQSQCRVCQKAYRVKNREKLLAYFSAYGKANRSKCTAKEKAWREKNAEHSKAHAAAYGQRWYSANRERLAPIRKLAQKRYAATKPHVIAEYAANRRARKRLATPGWANLVAIREWYSAAKICERDTGHVWHVDHIVPLTSLIVCGLHCEQNLQLLPGRLNSSKDNRFWPDMPA